MNLGRDISVIDVPDLGYDPQNLLSNVICSFRKFLFPLYTEHVRRQAYSGVGINMSFSSKYNPFPMRHYISCRRITFGYPLRNVARFTTFRHLETKIALAYPIRKRFATTRTGSR